MMPRKKVKVTSGTYLAATAYGEEQETERKRKKTKNVKNLKEKSADARQALEAKKVQFEKDVKAMRDTCKKSDVGEEISRKAQKWEFDYGFGPQKATKLGRLKLLPKLCGSLIYQSLSGYIPISLKFDFCPFPNMCCFGNIEQLYDWPKACSFRLSDRLQKVILDNYGFGTSSKLSPQAQEVRAFNIQCIQRNLIDEKADGCTLTVNGVSFALKTTTQDGLSSQMEARQNTGRLSYGGSGCILVGAWGDAMIMRIRSKRAGAGYHDLVSDGEPKRMLQLHDKFMMETRFEFGFKRDCRAPRKLKVSLKNENSKVQLPSFMQPLVLLHYVHESLPLLSSNTPHGVLNQQDMPNMINSNNTANRPLIQTNERYNEIAEIKLPQKVQPANKAVANPNRPRQRMPRKAKLRIPRNEMNLAQAATSRERKKLKSDRCRATTKGLVFPSSCVTDSRTESMDRKEEKKDEHGTRDREVKSFDSKSLHKNKTKNGRKNMIQHGRTKAHPSNEKQNKNTANISYNNIASNNHSSRVLATNDQRQSNMLLAQKMDIAMSEHDESPSVASDSYMSSMTTSTTTFSNDALPVSYGNHRSNPSRKFTFPPPQQNHITYYNHSHEGENVDIEMSSQESDQSEGHRSVSKSITSPLCDTPTIASGHTSPMTVSDTSLNGQDALNENGHTLPLPESSATTTTNSNRQTSVYDAFAPTSISQQSVPANNINNERCRNTSNERQHQPASPMLPVPPTSIAAPFQPPIPQQATATDNMQQYDVALFTSMSPPPWDYQQHVQYSPPPSTFHIIDPEIAKAYKERHYRRHPQLDANSMIEGVCCPEYSSTQMTRSTSTAPLMPSCERSSYGAHRGSSIPGVCYSRYSPMQMARSTSSAIHPLHQQPPALPPAAPAAVEPLVAEPPATIWLP